MSSPNFFFSDWDNVFLLLTCSYVCYKEISELGFMKHSHQYQGRRPTRSVPEEDKLKQDSP